MHIEFLSILNQSSNLKINLIEFKLQKCLIFSYKDLTFIFYINNRVLLERLIVNRPHPWGLLVTFIELIKNPQFKFWNHQFVRCAPEIEKYTSIKLYSLFERQFLWFMSLSKGCLCRWEKTAKSNRIK